MRIVYHIIRDRRFLPALKRRVSAPGRLYERPDDGLPAHPDPLLRAVPAAVCAEDPGDTNYRRPALPLHLRRLLRGHPAARSPPPLPPKTTPRGVLLQLVGAGTLGPITEPIRKELKTVRRYIIMPD